MLRSRHLIGCGMVAMLMLSACGQTTTYEEYPAEATDPAVEGFDEEAPGGAVVYPMCEEIGRRVPVEQCEDFTHLADRAQAGVAAFNAPDPMQRGEAHTLQLAISDAPTPEEIAAREQWEREQAAAEEAARQAEQEAGTNYPAPPEATITEPVIDEPVAPPPTSPPPPLPPTPAETVDPLQGETIEYTPLVGRFMRAELTGEGFDITPLTEASQEVLPDSVTTWSWRVIATTSGRRALTLTTIVEGCDDQGQCYPLRSTSQNYEVEVTVGLVGKIQDLLTAAPNWLRLVAGVLTALAVLVGAWFGLRRAFRSGRADAS